MNEHCHELYYHMEKNATRRWKQTNKQTPMVKHAASINPRNAVIRLRPVLVQCERNWSELKCVVWCGGEVVPGEKWEILQDHISAGKSHHCQGGITFLSLILKTILILQDLAMRFFALLWTPIILSPSLGFLLAGEGIFLNGVSGNFDSGLSEIPGTESLKFRLLHSFPGHVFFFFAWKFYTSGTRGFYIFIQDFQHLVPGWSSSSALSWGCSALRVSLTWEKEQHQPWGCVTQQSNGQS